MKTKLILIALAAAVSSCGYSSSHLTKDSTIPRIGLTTPAEPERDRLLSGGTREAILSQCPRGSRRAVVIQYIEYNFKNQTQGGNSDVITLIINERVLFPVGRNWQEVEFRFNSLNPLEDVIVRKGSHLVLTA